MEGDAVVRGTVSGIMQELLLALSADTKSTIRFSSDTVVLERTFRPGWQYAVTIALFPIGLVALAAGTQVDRGTVLITPVGAETVRMRMSGTFFKKSHEAINAVIQRNS